MWVKIVGDYHLVKYNMLIGHLVENSLLIITEKSSLIFFRQTHTALYVYFKTRKYFVKVYIDCSVCVEVFLKTFQ